jgi:hypothetical protein
MALAAFLGPRLYPLFVGHAAFVVGLLRGRAGAGGKFGGLPLGAFFGLPGGDFFRPPFVERKALDLSGCPFRKQDAYAVLVQAYRKTEGPAFALDVDMHVIQSVLFHMLREHRGLYVRLLDVKFRGGRICPRFAFGVGIGFNVFVVVKRKPRGFPLGFAAREADTDARRIQTYRKVKRCLVAAGVKTNAVIRCVRDFESR